MTSSVVGLELNDPSYYFVIEPKPYVPSVARHRQLWVGLTPTTPADGDKEKEKEKEKEKGTGTGTGPPATSGPGVSDVPVIPSSDQPAPIVPQPLPPPSNQPAVNIIPQTLVSSKSGVRMSNLRRDQRFRAAFYADYKGPPRIVTMNRVFDPDHYMPTQNQFYYDIVVSIRKITNSNYRLKEIGIEFPTTGITDPKIEPLLEQNYSGPGVRMLSNQRFIPYINMTKDYLQVRLIPRSGSSSPWIELGDDKTKEVSFRLAEANVSEVDPSRLSMINLEDKQKKKSSDRRGVARVFVYERYQVDDSGVDAYVQHEPYWVVKWNRRDDGH